MKKLDELNADRSVKERNISSLENSKRSLEENLQKRMQQIEELEAEIRTDKEKAKEEIENLRSHEQELKDEIVLHRLEKEKTLALSEQKIEFLQNQVKEHKDQNRADLISNEEKLNGEKRNHSNTKELVQKANEEASKIASKYEAKRKELKDLQITFSELEMKLGKLNSEKERE